IDDGAAAADDGAGDGGADEDDWEGWDDGEEEEERGPPAPPDERLAWEILGASAGAAALVAFGMALGAGTAAVDQMGDTTDEERIWIGALVGAGVGFPLGAALGTWLAGDETGGDGEAAGPVLGSLAGAAVGVGFGGVLGALTEDPWAGAAGGSILGGALSLVGAILGYELTADPDDETDEGGRDGEGSRRWAPFVASRPGGAVAGVGGTL
ncbi:MAG TPA: hypothetical protein RMH99_24005, partial [Sandaracinaceae bacterium LLY-WYZ-13_1]|nr:hypothetical protein [Sandaracinaceae bacterium LLY-WYZ-13_1]